jgi:hypothetical protein
VWTQQFHKYTRSGSSLTETNIPVTNQKYLYSTVNRFDPRNNVGISFIDQVGYDGKTYYTWTYTDTAVTCHQTLQMMPVTNAKFGQHTDPSAWDSGWVPDFYGYGNIHRLSDGDHVDVAYYDSGLVWNGTYWVSGPLPPWPWNIIYKFSWNASGVTIGDWKVLPLEAHAPSASLNLGQHVIGWGIGDDDSQGIAFDDTSGTLMMFYDFGYAYSLNATEGDGSNEYGHKMMRDPFGLMRIDNVTEIGGLGFESWRVVTEPDDQGFYTEMPWTGAWHMNEGWLINKFNYTVTTINPTSTGEDIYQADNFDFNAPYDSLPGYPDIPWGYNAILWKVAGTSIPDIAGELTEKRQKFARSPTDYTA